MGHQFLMTKAAFHCGEILSYFSVSRHHGACRDEHPDADPAKDRLFPQLPGGQMLS
jgi:hypothetical protein